MHASIRWYRHTRTLTGEVKAHAFSTRNFPPVELTLYEQKDTPRYFTVTMTREEAGELAAQLLKAAGP